MPTDRLFNPLKLGHIDLKHRIVMAPLTRLRADDNHVPMPFVKEYYGQRASVPGTLIITEATLVSPRASGFDHLPGIWNEAQVAGWREITDAVHAKGSFIFCQLGALGRVALPQNLEKYGLEVSSSSAKAIRDGGHVPKALVKDEIRLLVEDFANAANNAMKAGFDGVEIHGANGYLIDQFWQDTVNQRTDEYGGNIENRARFGLDITRAVIEAVGGDSKKVGMRLSPWSGFQGMRMEDSIPEFSHIVTELKQFDLAYLHLVESRIDSNSAAADGKYHTVNHENDPLVKLWGSQTPIILAGGYGLVKVRRVMDELYTSDNICIAFGRHFLSTPDLPFRIERGIELNPYSRATFYKKMSQDGYTDYEFSEEWLSVQKRLEQAE